MFLEITVLEKTPWKHLNNKYSSKTSPLDQLTWKLRCLCVGTYGVYKLTIFAKILASFSNFWSVYAISRLAISNQSYIIGLSKQLSACWKYFHKWYWVASIERYEKLRSLRVFWFQKGEKWFDQNHRWSFPGSDKLSRSFNLKNSIKAQIHAQKSRLR